VDVHPCPRVRFEATIPVLKHWKAVRTAGRVAILIDLASRRGIEIEIKIQNVCRCFVGTFIFLHVRPQQWPRKTKNVTEVVYFPCIFLFLGVEIIFDAKFEKSFKYKGIAAKRLAVKGGLTFKNFWKLNSDSGDRISLSRLHAPFSSVPRTVLQFLKTDRKHLLLHFSQFVIHKNCFVHNKLHTLSRS
jgi:hypothetical protein